MTESTISRVYAGIEFDSSYRSFYPRFYIHINWTAIAGNMKNTDLSKGYGDTRRGLIRVLFLF